MKTLKNYLHSFRLTKEFWKPLVIDLLFFSLLLIVLSLFGSYLSGQSAAITGGRTPEQIKQLLETSPELVAPLVSQLQSFMLLLLGGVALFLSGSLLAYSLTQAWIWNHLLKRKLTKKTYWRWNALHLALLFPLLAFALGFYVIKLLFGLLITLLFKISPTFYFSHQQTMDSVRNGASSIVSFLLALLFLVFLFLAYYAFVQKYKVWSSIGEAFGLFRQQFSSLGKLVLLALLTGIVLTLFSLLISKFLTYLVPWQQQQLGETIVQVIVAIFYVNWLRFSTLRTVTHA